MDGAGALSRSFEDGTSLATATRSLTCGVEGDNSSHHAAAAVNETRATAPTVTSRFRVRRGSFDAAAFVWAAGADGSACNIGKSSAASDTRSATAGRVAAAAARPARYSCSELRLTWSNEKAATEGSSDTNRDAGAGTSFAVSCTGSSRATPVSIALAAGAELSPSTSPTKRNPRLRSVRIKL